jgi:hypothetical protein
MSMSHKARQDLTVVIVLYLAAGFLYYKTLAMPASAAFFPRALLILFSALNTFILIMDVKQHMRTREEKGALIWKDINMSLLAFVGVIGYVVLFDLVGYFPATGIMIAGFMLALKVRPLWKIAAIIGGYWLFTYLLFVLWLKVRIL